MHCQCKNKYILVLLASGSYYHNSVKCHCVVLSLCHQARRKPLRGGVAIKMASKASQEKIT